MGRVVAGTAVGSIPEAVETARAGVIVPGRDPQAPARAILRLFRNPAERRATGELARRAYPEHFSIAPTRRQDRQLWGHQTQSSVEYLETSDACARVGNWRRDRGKGRSDPY